MTERELRRRCRRELRELEVGPPLRVDELCERLGDRHDDRYWQDALPDLSPAMIRRALGRTCYDADHEREAELVATIIMEWASELDYTTPHRSDEDAVRKLEAALNHRQGWL